MMTREMSAPLPFSPCGRRWIAGAKASARRMRGMSPRESSVSAERTPHPALRATFSHNGRRESESFVPHGEERVARLEPCRPQTGLHPSRRARCALLRMRSGMCDLLCDCPTGKSLKTCPALARKIFRFAFTPNHSYNSRHPAPTRGAYRDRHGRWVRGAVAAARRARKKFSQGELAHERRPRADERRDRGRQSRVVLAPVAGVKPAEVLRNPTGFRQSL